MHISIQVPRYDTRYDTSLHTTDKWRNLTKLLWKFPLMATKYDLFYSVPYPLGIMKYLKSINRWFKRGQRGLWLNRGNNAPILNTGPLLKKYRSRSSAARQSRWLTSRRAVEPLNYMPSSLFKHSIRLASRRAASDKRLQKIALYSVVASTIFDGGQIFLSKIV